MQLGHDSSLFVDEDQWSLKDVKWPASDVRYTYIHTGPAFDSYAEVTRLLRNEGIQVYTEDVEYLCNTEPAKPAKALAKHVMNAHHTKLSTVTKEKIGMIMRDQSNVLEIAITYGCEGSASDYYHARSCWWSDRIESRDWLESNGGGAVRAYSGNTIVGRVWFLPYKDGVILFNSYGKNELQHTETWAKILSQVLELPYYMQVFYLAQSNSDIYINSARGYYVGQFEVENPHEIDIDLKEPTEYVYAPRKARCTHCGIQIDEEDLIHIQSTDDNVCESCLSWHYHRGYTRNGEYDYIPDNQCVWYNGEYYHYRHADIVYAEDVHSYVHYNLTVKCSYSDHYYLAGNKGHSWDECSGCHRPICREAWRKINDKIYCPECKPSEIDL